MTTKRAKLTGTEQYRVTLDAAHVLIDLDNLEGAEVKLDEARLIIEDLKRDARRTIEWGVHI